MSEAVCEFEGCGRPVSSRGLCATHYAQQYRGKPLAPIQPRRPNKTIETQCNTCGQVKAREDFYLRVNGTLQSDCKKCMSKANNERQKKAREALRRLEALESV